VLRFLVTWMALTSSVANEDVNRGSRSDMIRLGSPNHLYTLLKYREYFGCGFYRGVTVTGVTGAGAVSQFATPRNTVPVMAV
jgi:hypothetical protein